MSFSGVALPNSVQMTVWVTRASDMIPQPTFGRKESSTSPHSSRKNARQKEKATMKPNPKPGPARLMDFLQALHPGHTGWSAGWRATPCGKGTEWNELVIVHKNCIVLLV